MLIKNQSDVTQAQMLTNNFIHIQFKRVPSPEGSDGQPNEMHRYLKVMSSNIFM